MTIFGFKTFKQRENKFTDHLTLCILNIVFFVFKFQYKSIFYYSVITTYYNCNFLFNFFQDHYHQNFELLFPYLKSTISKKKLNKLTLLSIEIEMLNKNDYNNLINNFEYQKIQKTNFK